MRILFLNHNVAWSGGTFFRAYHLGRMLVRRGHDVTLVSTSARARSGTTTNVREGVTVVEAPDLMRGAARSGWDMWNAWCRSRYLRDTSWDLVHAFDSRPVVIGPALSVARRGVPLVMDWADWWGRGGTIDERAAGSRLRPVIRPIETFFEEHFRTRATGSTVISAALERRAVALGVKPESILRLPGGCDPEHVTPRDRQASRRHLGLSGSIPIVGYLGTLLQHDASLLFDAFAAMRQRRPDIQLVLIGKPKVTVPNLDGIVQTGFVQFDDMLHWLGACDLMLLPQRDSIANRARWPSKVNDYLAAGRPVVASAVGDIAELFQSTAIGASVEPTAKALADAALALCDDPARLAACGAAARTIAEGDLSWPHLASQLDDWYAKVVTKGSRSR